MVKIKLTYIPTKCVLINGPHYDLHGVRGNECFNIACIATDKTGAEMVRKMIKSYLETLDE